ncbi:MAG TPA: MurR/RpiR family transcriptional regulator [Hypericibacter adhaerens]|jgi:DNA-binding MurR/RpiR family transcriptional regulator|uniref:RpiR family transcriptional regulator n=1 Tax=Hypericibacter adhaerens TaxID=2602016 RepID=A0A5J6MS85_9PROT|nr:MurR/RpiR family transcriptional regulator [Hypericibacter adhaerens]QEX20159.1 RpiR family transcriptional regulator [Hypericibacter adhaerens]HWA46358.1 MurR/RpiR family transcriptional regulator [Hypericibacter adhaerens]
MSQDQVLGKLGSKSHWRTQSETLLARYFQAHLEDLPFETAASIAKKVGVSAVTVGRFLRRLGYRRLSELTQDLRMRGPNSAWQIKDPAPGKSNGSGIQGRQLQAHIENLTRIFGQTSTPAWSKAVKLIAGAPRIFVVSFQNLRGIGHYFASQLDYARPGVRFLDGEDGTFVDLFDGEPRKTCLVIIESRRYARKAAPLAERAKEAGIKVIAVTDIYCGWADDADVSLTDPGEGEVFWDSTVSTVALLELLLESVIERLGDKVPARIKHLTALQDYFGDFGDM